MKSDVISIIIPTLSAIQELKECLQSISSLSYSKSKLEVIIIDNGLPQKTSLSLQKKYSVAIFIKNKKNQSFAHSINQGVRKAKGEFICITNDDVTFEKESLKTLISHLIKHPEIGIIGGKVYSKTKPIKITSAGFSMNWWTGAIYMQPEVQKMKEVDWIQGCLMVVRKLVIQKIGYLDEKFPFFFEDYDLCVRAKKAGWQVIYLPTAIFWHRESTTTSLNLKLKYFHWYRSKFLFMKKHLPLLNRLSIFCIQTFIIMPYRTLVLQDGRLVPFLRSFFSNIIHLPKDLPTRIDSNLV